MAERVNFVVELFNTPTPGVPAMFDGERTRAASLHKALRYAVMQQDVEALVWLSANVQSIRRPK